MNVPVVILVSWLLFGAELGVRGAFRLGSTPIAPSFIIPLLVFVAMACPPITVWWTALLLGLVTDLTFDVELKDGLAPVTVVGPYSLGYLLAGQLALTLRGVMIRRNPLTIGILSIPAALVAHVVVVTFFTLRSLFGEPMAWSAGAELATRLGSSVASGVSGIALGLILVPLGPAMGLHVGQPRRFARKF